MELRICDICGETIKGKLHCYIIGEQKQSEYNDRIYLKKVEAKELCDECSTFLGYIFNLRRTKVKESKLKIKKMLQVKKPKKAKGLFSKHLHCQCLMPIDEGDVNDGIPNGICYNCGKKIKGEEDV